MLRLRTLGGVYVADEHGEPLTGAASQRRVLGLLAALAVAGDRGFSREKLLALLWPEADEERARHSLTQALYSARRALGVDDLFLAGGDVRVNPERLQSDVQELEEALDTGDLDRAAVLYQGPFADGFFFPGSTEFEQWVSTHRFRLEDRIATALDRLAQRAEAAGQAREALECRKRLAAIRPLDASTAVALMTTLAHTGDRAGALQHARLHETLLREQLGLEPDPVVASLAERLRGPIDWRTDPPQAVTGGLTGPADGAPGLDEDAVAGWTDGSRSVQSEGSLPSRRARQRSPGLRGVWVVVAAGLVAAIVALLRPAPAPAPAPPAPPPLEQNVVVAPFRVAGASASLAYLRDGLVELLSTRLADDSSARSVDAGAVLAAWRAAGLAGSADVPRETMVRLAADLGAERVVIGSVVGTPSRAVLTAAAVDVASGLPRGEATVEGPADSITALVDRLAVRLLLLGAGEDASLSSQTTGSLRALRAFLDGQAAFRRASYQLALRRYEETLRLDSTFALAALQLARTADRLQLVEPRTRALAIAWRERDALDARARAVLVALAGPRYPAPSEVEEQVAAWERLIDLTPDRAESWYEFGARLIQEGALAGAADGGSRAGLALQRALQLDPTHTPTRELLAQIADRASLQRVAAADSSLPLAPFLRWRAALLGGDSAAVRSFRDTLPRLGPRNLRAIIISAQIDAAGLGDARRAVQQLRVRAARPAERTDAALAEHALALNEGRLRDALAATNRLAEIQPGSHAHLRLRVLDGLYADGDARAAGTAAQALERFVALRAATDPIARAVQVADACVLAQWRLRRADTTGVRRTIDELRAEPLRMAAAAPAASAAPMACAELLEAGLAVALNRADAAGVVARLDSLAFTPGVSGDAIAYAHLLVARLHDRLGNPRAALAAVRRRDELVGWPRYLAAAWRDEGRYAALAGVANEARPSLTRYLALRTNPDAGLRNQVEEVRRMLAGTAGSVPE
ncbi:MAG: BTAD domain-containing putative transcriptional regulator [Gemmatimonadales bacterium]